MTDCKISKQGRKAAASMKPALTHSAELPALRIEREVALPGEMVRLSKKEKAATVAATGNRNLRFFSVDSQQISQRFRRAIISHVRQHGFDTFPVSRYYGHVTLRSELLFAQLQMRE